MKTTVKGKVKVFSGQAAWFYVTVPRKHTDKLKGKVKTTAWGFIPIEVTVGKTKWNTSLLPMGDGSFFIALKAQVRKKEDISLGDTLKITYTL